MSDPNTIYAVKKCGKHILHIYDFIYECNYYWIEAKDHAEYCKVMKRQFNLNIEVDPKDGHFRVIEKHGIPIGVIWAKRNQPDSIAHECFHAASYFLRSRGVELSDESDEAFAYLMSYLIRAITKAKFK